MTGCPDPDCKQRQHELRIDVKGLTKRCEEMKLHMAQMCGQMLKKKHVWLFVAVFGITFMGTAFGLYHEVKSADERYVRKDSAEHKQVLRNEENIRQLQKGQDEIKKDLKETKNYLDTKLESVRREIINAIQNGGNN